AEGLVAPAAEGSDAAVGPREADLVALQPFQAHPQGVEGRAVQRDRLEACGAGCYVERGAVPGRLARPVAGEGQPEVLHAVGPDVEGTRPRRSAQPLLPRAGVGVDVEVL